jgi:hypothetical protein
MFHAVLDNPPFEFAVNFRNVFIFKFRNDKTKIFIEVLGVIHKDKNYVVLRNWNYM